MIYNLTHEFTMLEQTEGLIQNMTLNTPIELVTCTEHPQKDSGVALMPLEKMNFATCGDERVFARCTKLDGTIATLSVVNLYKTVKCNCKNDVQNFTLVPKIRKFETAGTYEWTVPQDAWYEVTVTGAGGAGGNAMITAAPEKGWVSVVGGSGGAGGTAQKSMYLSKDTVIPIQVGKGGVNTKFIPAAEIISTEPDGEESFFGVYCSATGGGGGQTQPRAKSIARRTGNSGIGKNGDVNLFGGRAIAACINKNFIDQDVHFYSPGCSPSIYGGGGYAGFVSSNGQNGVNGAGGEGAVAQLWDDTSSDKRDLSMVNKPFYGGDGGDGVVVIRWFEFQ